jgi:protein O-mannosyl-transferase
LIFDYGTAWVSGWREVLPYAVVVLALVTGTCVALGRWPVFGFLGVWFFAVLAPTSSVLPGNRQTLAEHRMYLPLAPVLVLGVGLVVQQMRRSARGPGRLFLVGSTVGAIGLALAFLTAQRNEVYDSELVLYRDTVTKRPGNDIARYNLAGVLAGSGALEAAVAQYEASIQLKPDTARVHYNLANALMDLRRVPEAVASYEAALRLDPKFAPAHLNLGDALVRLERRPEAVEHYRAALQLRPDFMEARDKLGTALLELGQLPEAEAQLREVLNANPNLVATHCNLGTVYLVQGKRAEAREQYEEALQLAPDFKAARDGLERTK